jgi:predicted nucleotidyltransferase
VADWPAFRAADILGVLVSHGVDFVVVGGLAAVFHGSTRVTQDLDVCYSTEPANLEVLGRALIELQAKLFGIEEDMPFVPDAKTLQRTEILTLATKHGKLDVLRSPSGAPPYSELRENAELVEAEGLAIRVASPVDLIAMKQSAGRAKDLADIEELEAILDVRKRT